MSSDAVTIAKEMFTNFTAGNVEKVLSIFHPDAKLFFPGSPEILPWAGEYKGSEVLTFLQAIGSSIDYETYDAHTYYGQGERATVLSRETFIVKETGKKVNNDIVALVKVADGLITEFIEYSDTAAMHEGFCK